MGLRASKRSVIALSAIGVLASTGTALVGLRNLLAGQADTTRRIIPKSWASPPRADGVYIGSEPVQPWRRGMDVDLHLMVFGDSTATGYGCDSGADVPGALVARALAERTGQRVRLSTKAIVGATSKGLAGQVDAMFVAGPPPDAAVIMIGANDITGVNGISRSAYRLGTAVRRLNASGAVVVVGTCPDFGAIAAIPQPLRWVMHARGHRLASAQAAAVRAAGGTAVPFADLRASALRRTPELLISQDQYHPSAAGYALAANQLIPALCAALGIPTDSGNALAGLSRDRLLPPAWLRRRQTTGVPAPVVPTDG